MNCFYLRYIYLNFLHNLCSVLSTFHNATPVPFNPLIELRRLEIQPINKGSLSTKRLEYSFWLKQRLSLRRIVLHNNLPRRRFWITRLSLVSVSLYCCYSWPTTKERYPSKFKGTPRRLHELKDMENIQSKIVLMQKKCIVKSLENPFKIGNCAILRYKEQQYPNTLKFKNPRPSKFLISASLQYL